MGRKKLERFEENKNNPLIIQEEKANYHTIKGNWNKMFFKNKQATVLELACGRGEYTIGLAERFPEKNFVGIDIKGSRIWKGASYALKNQMKNVAFLRTYIQNLEDFFAENEVQEIWITFPDPRPKDRDIKRRLTHLRFLEMYQKILKAEGKLYLKTDNTDLFWFSWNEIRKVPIKNLIYTWDLYNSKLDLEHYALQTRYEKMFTDKGSKIKYLKCNF